MEEGILAEFHKSLINFIDELIETFPTEPDLVLLRIFLKDKIPIKKIMDFFNQKIYVLKDRISARDETIFQEYNFFMMFDSSQLNPAYQNILNIFSKDKIPHFKTMWRMLDEYNKETTWKWIDSFVYLARKYQQAIQNKNENF